MEQLNTITQPNPNQLDLFQGKVLSRPQLEEVAKYINRREELAKVSLKTNAEQVAMLEEAGFIRGVHFTNEAELVVRSHEQTFGYSFNNTEYTAKVSYRDASIKLVILYKKFDSTKNEIVTRQDYPNFQSGGKIACSSITDNWRSLKLSSMLKKIKELDERAVDDFNQFNKDQKVRNEVLVKYQKLYPNATLNYSKEWKQSRYGVNKGYYVHVLKIEFPSTSYIKLEVSSLGNVSLLEKQDVLYVKPTLEQELERLSKQPAKELS